MFSETEVRLVNAGPGDLLIFDGIFLHRPELRDRWHFSVFLEAWDRVNQGRVDRACEGAPRTGAALLHHLTWWWHRHVQVMVQVAPE